MATVYANLALIPQNETRRMNMKIAMAQLIAKANDRDENLHRQIRAIEIAKKANSDMIIFPEMFDIGYTQPGEDVNAWRNLAISQDDEYIKILCGHFRKFGIWGCVTFLQKGEKYPRNSLVIINNVGKIVGTYSKIHLYEPFKNDACCEPGDKYIVFDFPLNDGLLKIGTMICADRDFPESARVLMKMGAELIISPNACPLNGVLSDMLRIRALENAVAILTVNYPSPMHDGHSAYISQEGEYVNRCDDQESIEYATIDVLGLKNYRKSTNWGDSFRKPKAYNELGLSSIAADFIGRKNGIGEIRDR